MRYVLSRFQADDILSKAGGGRAEAEASLDLGRTRSAVSFDGGFVVFPDGNRVDLELLKNISGESSCFLVDGCSISKISFYLPSTRRYYRLVTSGADVPPTAEISGVRMHRTKGTDPMSDTLSKIRTIKPIRGRVLDTCCGLGYTAIESLKAGAEEVYTVEEDEGMLRLSELNPWSRELCDGRIKRIVGDVYCEVEAFEDGFFDAVIHDPPRLSLAGRLYSLEFYGKLYRVLKGGGRLFHYVGSPGSRYRGKKPVVGVMRRLAEAGFRDVREEKAALGVSARK